MKPTQMTTQGLLPQSLKALLAGGILCTGVSSWATPSQGFICITDNNGSPTVAYSNLIGITSPANPTPSITTGVGQVNVQFYVESAGVGGYFFAPDTGYAILTLLGAPDFVMKYNVTSTGPSQDSLTISFVDTTSASFASLLSLANSASAPNVALTGGEQDVSSDLEPASGDESHGALQICIQCGASTPDTTPTWPLLGLAVIGMASMYRFVPRFAKGTR
jgi:hypothetical protein